MGSIVINVTGGSNYYSNPYGTSGSDQVSWTNTQVSVGDIIKKDRILTLASEIGKERQRRGQPANTVSISDKPTMAELNSMASYSGTANVTNNIKASDINRIIMANYDRGQTCLCNCNYCSCNCNYCTCNCNYCTCNCNYCTCNCNYSCTCNCNY